MRNLIFGARGQDGSYLSDLLLSRGETVFGAKRRSSSSSDWRLSTAKLNPNFTELDCDITDFSSVYKTIIDYAPDRIYNLAAQSVTEDSLLPIKCGNSIEYRTFKQIWDAQIQKGKIPTLEKGYIEIINLPKDSNSSPKALGYWSGMGTWFKITQISRHKWKDKVVQMDQKFGSVCVTPNHSILDINQKVCKPEENPWLLNVRKFNFDIKALNTIKFGDVEVNKENIKYLCYFLGAFIAEGHTYYNKSNGSYIIGISEQSKEWLEKLQEYLSKFYKINSWINEHKKDGYDIVYQLEFSSKKLYTVLRKLCGLNSETKKLPKWFSRLNLEDAKYLFEALIYGDGSIEKNSFRYTTKSYKLSCQFSWLLTMLKYDYTVNTEYNENGTYYHFRTCDQYQPNQGEDGKKLQYIDYDGYVYDIAVDEVSNFTVGVGNIVVHNSQVGTSFDQPFYTYDSIVVGTTNILEALRMSKIGSKLYQASTSEMFGKNYDEIDGQKYQDEQTRFVPQSPYGIAKLAAHEMVRLYREAYGLWACSGILFNHCSPRRGEYFVSRKITKWIGETVMGQRTDNIFLGNLRACRDWGHAKDYVEAMTLMLDRESPKDYVIGTGETYSVYDFWCLACLFGGVDREKIQVDESLKRPAEVDYLRAKPDLALTELGWKPKITFKKLVKEMVNADINYAAKKK